MFHTYISGRQDLVYHVYLTCYYPASSHFMSLLVTYPFLTRPKKPETTVLDGYRSGLLLFTVRLRIKPRQQHGFSADFKCFTSSQYYQVCAIYTCEYLSIRITQYYAFRIWITSLLVKFHADESKKGRNSCLKDLAKANSPSGASPGVLLHQNRCL